MEITTEKIENIGTEVRYHAHNATIVETDAFGAVMLSAEHDDRTFLFHVLITPDRECMYVDLTEAPFDIKQWPQIKRCMDDLYALWKEYKELKQSENQHV